MVYGPPDERAFQVGPAPYLRSALRAVLDPELAVNVVDLALVYHLAAAPGGEMAH